MDIEETPIPLPSAPAVQISRHVRIQPPLSRRGHGPGLIIIMPEDLNLGGTSDSLDPPPLQKWAEEGYAVAQLTFDQSDVNASTLKDLLTEGIQSLSALQDCDQGKLGVVVYASTGDPQLSYAIEKSDIIAAVISYNEALELQGKPQLVHFANESKTKTAAKGVTTYHYQTRSSEFVIPGHPDFSYASAAVSHTRCLTFLKKHMDGPFFDLEAIWEEHTEFEFGNRSVAKTMGTMVQEPYVNHIPTMTGGVGRTALSNFYRYHFIWNNPDDTILELVSRTIGIDRVVDEFVMKFTHNKMIDWLLPGIPPTGKNVCIPFVSVVNIRGDRLYHEHISWDQATVLMQIGLMPTYLTYPYDLPDGRKPAPGKKFEYRIPAAGVETAEKLKDQNAVPSNGMFEFEIREVDDVSQ